MKKIQRFWGYRKGYSKGSWVWVSKVAIWGKGFIRKDINTMERGYGGVFTEHSDTVEYEGPFL